MSLFIIKSQIDREGYRLWRENRSERPSLKLCTCWARHTDESGLSVDFAEAHERCWRCGCRRRLERCHIVPDSLGGEDIPSNFVILCKRCHLDNPNVADPEIMWDWLRAYSVPLYDTFWDIQGMEEYKKIYGVSVMEEFSSRDLRLDDPEVREIRDEVAQGASYHFGDPHLNVATLAGLQRMLFKEYDRRHGLETGHPVASCISRNGFWQGK